MRIAQVAPLFESVPPARYGGTERVVSWLTEELVSMGHEITLFASGDSRTNARLVSVCERALWQDVSCRETLPHHVLLVEEVLRYADEFDVIHFHCDYVHFPLVRRLHVPTVTTLHGLVHPPDHEKLFRAFPEVALVAISESQQSPLPQAPWCGTVHHGMPPGLHTYREQAGDYLLFLGRISQDKGIEQAIEIASQAHMHLKVAAKIYDEDRSYFEQTIRPIFKANENITFVGEVGGAEKNELLGNAYGLLFPVVWSEPFGLVLIEALACGTPVIAWNRGAVPEIVQHGVNGFVVDSISDAVLAVASLKHISRRCCRRRFEERFTSRRMAERYVGLYEKRIRETEKRL